MMFNDAFKEIRMEHGLKQKPNAVGVVYGVCRTQGCPNYRRIGFYTGGFCKKCSTRHRDHEKKYVLSGIDIKGSIVTMPNPEIEWITKKWVHDLSDRFTPEERKAFYSSPEEWESAMDRLSYREELEQKEPNYDDKEEE